ncbi:transglycosylase SLT domain-containing protein [Limnohabitans sp. 15K]|uniref:transglycosylase SLT domain-containing protein n=1 Tax=Limnohabitans sp. 15K TaxID=1100706 RepID=UPI000C1DD34D|nr:transglycosylase SLT domain-containing protein [Limnohabitans sp. 15K]PIT81221.1 lytic transglycosylase [Limnohabitans sp. 15K]
MAVSCLGLTLFLGACATAPSTTTELPTKAAQIQSPKTAEQAKVAASEAAADKNDSLKDESVIGLKPRSQLTLTPPKDIWERIRRGFAMPDLENELVSNREQWYSGRPDYMLRMTERSRPYLFHVVEELERRNMPTELALLPFIESAFNPQAVSSAKAAGMWQFMPATGKFFDLKQNLFRDDRRDVLESTRAALDYLQKLYGMFGDWHLALAAYNWGEGSVGRALARNKAQGKPLNYSDLNMPNETRYYVPKLQAVKNIVAQPEAFNTQLPLIQNHPYFKSVPIERDIDVAVAVKLAAVSLEDFKALNPSMKRPVILAAGTPKILLPWDNATVFERNLQAHANKRLATWTAWQAPKSMKPEEVAQQLGMPVEQLRSVNDIPLRMMITAGSTLLVHRKGQLDNDVTEHLADNGQLGLAPEMVLKRIAIKARKGDSLASLAARHGVSEANMAAWNKLKVNAHLATGQTLTILVPSEGARRVTRPTPNNADRPKANNPQRKTARQKAR